MQGFLDALNRLFAVDWGEVKLGFKRWFQEEARMWAISVIAHLGVLLVLLAILDAVVTPRTPEAPTFEATALATPTDPPITRFEVGDTPLDPSELSTDTLTQFEALPVAVSAQHNDDSPVFEERGGGTPTGTPTGLGAGFDISASGLGPKLKGAGGVDMGLGTGMNFGRGGTGIGFGLRGSGNREAVPGVTKASERAVAAALNWLARHQNPDGSWSIERFHGCTGRSCTGGGATSSNPAATALALLPFLAAGQTHETKGPYQAQITKGLQWLVKNQLKTGALCDRDHYEMYAHGIATIALCEAFGMTQDSKLGGPAQAALRYIETGQNRDGAWRYEHGTESSDTSVFGWQVMALKSGQMAGLQVNPVVLEKCKGYLKAVSYGAYDAQFYYQPGRKRSSAMTAVGLLMTQYLGAHRNHSTIVGGCEFLVNHLPSNRDHDIYYWYYATQVLHNVSGPDWDKWNRQLRRMLIESQTKTGCAAGSWEPEGDAWGGQGGRLMMTSLSALTLEVYYRYLPLYKLDRDPTPVAIMAPDKKDAEKMDAEKKDAPAEKKDAPANETE